MSASGCNAIEKSASLKKQCSGHALNIIDNGKRATLGRTQECRVQSGTTVLQWETTKTDSLRTQVKNGRMQRGRKARPEHFLAKKEHISFITGNNNPLE